MPAVPCRSKPNHALRRLAKSAALARLLVRPPRAGYTRPLLPLGARSLRPLGIPSPHRTVIANHEHIRVPHRGRYRLALAVVVAHGAEHTARAGPLAIGAAGQPWRAPERPGARVLSPRVRGNRLVGPCAFALPRSIPARAGETCEASLQQVNADGLSPRTQGRRPHESSANVLCGSVPRSFESRRPRLPVLGIPNPKACSFYRAVTYGVDRIIERHLEYHFKRSAPRLLGAWAVIGWFYIKNNNRGAS